MMNASARTEMPAAMRLVLGLRFIFRSSVTFTLLLAFLPSMAAKGSIKIPGWSWFPRPIELLEAFHPG